MALTAAAMVHSTASLPTLTSTFTATFLAALQATMSIILTLGYGVMAGQLGLLSSSSASDVSRICVRVFMPALLMTTVGKELSQDSFTKYVAILIWAPLTSIISMGIGLLAVRTFSLPRWVVPAVTFNNTTSLPLLLVQSIYNTGILDFLLESDVDSAEAALNRAKSFFLVSSIVANALTSSLGPMLLDSDDDEFPRRWVTSDASNGKPTNEDDRAERAANSDSGSDDEADRDNDPRTPANETTSLFPHTVVQYGSTISLTSYRIARHRWDQLPDWLQLALAAVYSFFNPPIVGALIGIVIGLVPPLHTLLLAMPKDGGYLTASLTRSIMNIGDLFASLQVVVVGVKLSSSFRKMRRGEDDSGEFLPWRAVVFVLGVRFVLWPVMSISAIYVLIRYTSLIPRDPILWFILMLVPTGPPAMKLSALVEVSGDPASEVIAISKFLSVSYALSPLSIFAVVASMSACEAVMQRST